MNSYCCFVCFQSLTLGFVHNLVFKTLHSIRSSFCALENLQLLLQGNSFNFREQGKNKAFTQELLFSSLSPKSMLRLENGHFCEYFEFASISKINSIDMGVWMGDQFTPSEKSKLSRQNSQHILSRVFSGIIIWNATNRTILDYLTL